MSKNRFVTNCEDCACREVCKYREKFGEAAKQIFESYLTLEDKTATSIKNCPFLEITVRCPFYVGPGPLQQRGERIVGT